jgi:DNA sulfur modification protein DndD
MKLRILGFESKNLRCLDCKIDLTDNNKIPYKVSLIQVPNGHGKSSLSALIRLAIDGSATNRTFDLYDFRSEDRTEDNGEFVLNLSLNDNLISIKMFFDFITGEVTYFTNTPALGGFKKGLIIKNEYKSLMMYQNPSWTKLFIFDGELCHKLLEKGNSSAKKSIETLCQVYLFDNAIDYLDRKKERHINQISTSKKSQVKTNKGMKQITTNLEKIKKQIEKIINRKKSLEDKIITLDESIKNSESKFFENEKDEEFNKLTSKLQEDIDNSYSNLNKIVIEAKESILKPYNLFKDFKKDVQSFKQCLVDHGIPEDTTSEWFKDQANKKVCICGREMDEGCKDHILSTYKNYMSGKTSGTINQIRVDLEKIENSKDFNVEDLINKIDICYNKSNEVEQNLNYHTSGKIEGNASNQKELNKFKVLISDKKISEEELKVINREPNDRDKDENSWCLSYLLSRKDELDKQIMGAQGTIDLYKQLKVIDDILKKSKQVSSNNLTNTIMKICNERLNKVLQDQPIQIESITENIKILKKKQVSVGQTLSTAYIFLTSLLERGNNSFPLVMDSPAGPIDNDVRAEIANIIPDLTDQFISFVISPEREAFTEVLDDKMNGNIQYITGFNFKNKQIPEKDKNNFTIVGNNGAFNFEKNYFYQFQTGEKRSRKINTEFDIKEENK